LVPAVEQVCPTAEHRTCVRHLYANFRSAGFKGVLLKDMLWNAASSYTQLQFQLAMEEIKTVNESAYNFLAKIDPSSWCRGWFNTSSKSDLVHNDCAECFNSWILDYRQMTILSMLEGIKNKLMKRYVRKRGLIAAMEEGSLGPKIVEKLQKEEDGASYCECTYAGDGIFEVECLGKRFAVNVEGRTCGCRKWDVTGIPCNHVISAIIYHVGNPRDYLSDYYSRETYLRTYQPMIYSVPSEDQWPRSDQPIIEPPKSRATPGRPRKIRFRGVKETRNPNAIRNGGNKVQCGHCKKLGHNKRTCIARQRHEKRREQVQEYYRSTAGVDWNLDMVSCN
jgi:hypothetical protein